MDDKRDHKAENDNKAKRPYIEPKLEKRQQLAEVTEGIHPVTGGIPAPG